MIRIIRSLDVTTNPGFALSVKKLPEDVKLKLKEVMIGLLQNPQPKRLRLEKLRGNNKPPIYTIHITANHSHKLSFEIVGDVAVLRIAATHKEIDRKP